MARAFNSTSPNLNHAVNQLNRGQSLLGSLLASLQGIVGFFNGNGSASAPNAMVENAVTWAVSKVDNNYITYSQSNRNLNNPNGTSYDCSSFLITAFNQAGFEISATYTGNMRSAFTSQGWEWHPSSGGVVNADILTRGDILLNEALHTQMYIGNGEDVNCGGTPAGRIPHNSDNFGRGWDGYLHYPVTADGNVINVPGYVNQSGIIGDYTANYGSIPWSTGTGQRAVFDLWSQRGSSSQGIATLDNRYLVAMTPKFGSAGDKVDITLVGGGVINAILADIKGSDAGSEWGHMFGSQVSLVEFEAIGSWSTSQVPDNWRYKDVNYVTNLGSIL